MQIHGQFLVVAPGVMSKGDGILHNERFLFLAQLQHGLPVETSGLAVMVLLLLSRLTTPGCMHSCNSFWKLPALSSLVSDS
jgi:hypothetical protein